MAYARGSILSIILLIAMKDCYGQACGGPIVSNGTFTTPGYPSDYGPYQNCVWEIEKPGGYQITLSFTYFYVESGYDYVYIYDYVNNAPQLMNSRYTGNLSPFSLTSTGNKMRVEFKSDVSIQYRGFSATVSFVRVPTVLSNGHQQRIQSPGFPSSYNNSISEIWIFVNSNPADILTIAINDMNITGGDYLEMRDGSTNSSGLIIRLDGTENPGPIFTSSNSIWIKFKSDNHFVNKGFAAMVTAGCYVNITSNQGTITSPGYPNKINNSNLHCQWRIIRSSNIENITFYLHELQSENGTDFLFARNSLENLNIFSGNITNQVFLKSVSKDIDIYFNISSQSRNAGFNMTFSRDCVMPYQMGGFFIGGNNYGGKANLVCHTGYYLPQDNPTIHCGFNRVWCQPLPICEKWYSPRINYTNKEHIFAGSSIQILCIGNTTSQSQIELVTLHGDPVINYRSIMLSNYSYAFIFDSVQVNNTNIYLCKETINGRDQYSDGNVSITVMPNTKLIIEPNSYVSIGTNVYLKCISHDVSWLKNYTWYKDDKLMNGTYCSTLNLPNVSSEDRGTYHCVATSDHGSSSSNHHFLNVWSLSTPTILAHGLQSNDIIQEGSNVTLNCYTVDDKINLTWVDNFGYIVSNSPILKFENITKHNAGIYRCKSQKEVAFMYSPIFRINISYIRRPSLQAFPSNVVDKHTNVLLQCNVESYPSITSVQWFFNNIPINNYTSNQLFLNGVGEYSIGLYTCSLDFYASTYNSSVYLLVNFLKKPVISVSSNTTTKEGDSFVMKCETSGSGNIKFQWFKDNKTKIFENSLQFYVINNVRRNDSGNYQCEAKNNYGSKSSNKVILDVEYLDFPYISKRNLNNTVELTCSSNGNPLPSYQWIHHGKIVGNGSLLLLKNFNKSYIATYDCHVWNTAGQFIAKIDVNKQHLRQPKLKILPSEQVYAGDSVTMICTTDGSKPITYQWFKGNLQLQDEATSMLTLTELSREEAGLYRCQASNNENLRISETAVLDVYYIDNPIINSTNNLSDVVMNQELEISCRALGNPLPGIQWLNEDNKIVNNSSILHFKEIHITDSGRYVCKASLGKLVKETTVKIIVNYLSPPRLHIIPKNVLKENSTLVVTCKTESNLPVTYKIFKYDTELVSIQNQYIIENIRREDLGDYKCIVSNKLEHKTTPASNVAVKFLDPPYISRSYLNRTTELNCSAKGNPRPSFQWTHLGKVIGNDSMLVLNNINDTYIGMYVCHVQNDAGKHSAMINANTHYLKRPRLTIFPSENISEGDTVTMICAADASNPITHQWFRNNISLQATDSILTITQIHRNDAGLYRCQTSFNETTKMSDSIFVDVYYVDVPILNPTSNLDHIKVNDSFSVSCVASGNPAFLIQWWFGNLLVVRNSSILQVKRARVNDSGQYVCKVSTGKISKEASIEVTVNYLKLPEVQILPNQTIRENSTLVLICHAESNLPVSYKLFRGSGELTNQGQLIVGNVRREDAGLYKCVALNKLENKTSIESSIVVWYHDKPEIFLSAVSSGKYLLEGDNATLICNTSAIPHPTISWYKNGQLISNTSYLSLNNISRQDTGKYVCKTKNEDSVLANWKYLLVDYIEKPTIEKLDHRNPVVGQTFSLQCNPQTSRSSTYLWYKDGLLISSPPITTGNVVEFQNITESDTGVYQCKTINILGNSSSNVLYMEVYDYCKDVTCHDENSYCVNGESSFECSCKKGYNKRVNGECEPIFEVKPVVLAAALKKETQFYRWTTICFGGIVGLILLVLCSLVVIRKCKKADQRSRKMKQIDASRVAHSNPVYQPTIDS